MRWFFVMLFFCSGMLAGSGVAMSQEIGNIIVKTGVIEEDLYLAGSKVRVQADVKGDVVVSGGEVSIQDSTAGDVLAAGGKVLLNAHVEGDVRLMGGEVSIAGDIGGDVVAVGGSVRVAQEARIGGRLWVAGGEVVVAGHMLGDLRVMGGNVVVSGVVEGDAEVTSGHVVLLPGAIIKGDLVYRSQHQATLGSATQVLGKLEHEAGDFWPVSVVKKVVTMGLLLLMGFGVCLLLMALVVCWLFSEFFSAVVGVIRNDFWSSLGYGVVIFIGFPLLFLLLVVSIVGIPLALLFLGFYVLAWMLSALVGLCLVADQCLRWLGRVSSAGFGMRALSIVVAMLLVLILHGVPVLGTVFLWVLVLACMGALFLYLFRRSVV